MVKHVCVRIAGTHVA